MKYTLAQKTYLSILMADNYPEQEPAYICAKWYDLLWFIIPMLGFLIFIAVVNNRYNEIHTRTKLSKNRKRRE